MNPLNPPEQKLEKCSLCGSDGLETFEAFEMMYETREKFVYSYCDKCELIVLRSNVENWGKHYPENYYSKKSVEPKDLISKSRRYLSACRSIYLATGSGFLGKWVQVLRPDPLIKVWHKLHVKAGDWILDVGCGSGSLLYSLRSKFNTCGIDPFLEEDIHYSNNLTIFKDTLETFGEKIKNLPKRPPEGFDLIMFHHSFEHLLEPEKELASASRLLGERGKILIRIPVASSYAWKKYRQNWVQLDPPRHTHLFSKKSLELICENNNLRISDSVYDSTEFQFWGSEQYEKGVGLMSESSYLNSPSKSIFKKTDINFYKKASLILNELELGDQASFIIEKF